VFLSFYREKETFRVYVVMPLIPGFEGQYGTSKATALQAITHWNYRSISQGQQSLLARLAKEVGDPHRYICFFGLRTWSEMNGRLVSEIVYVHSKLAIVDDNRVLIGSANINDRSLVGDRDSEISVLFEDIEFVRGMMNGENIRVGKFASNLRKRLFREHLGDFDGTQINYQDPISDSFYKDTWLSTAARNTTMFEKVCLFFFCVLFIDFFCFVDI
jgi:phospholipase D1/2